MKTADPSKLQADSAQNSGQSPSEFWAESGRIPVGGLSALGNFPQLSLIDAPKLAETLVFSRVVLKGERAYEFICQRLDPTPPGESTFYEWRPLALVAPRRARYDPIDLLYLEIFGLHVRQWESREDASLAIRELFGWQQQMEALHLHPIDSALLLGGAMRRFSVAVGEAAEIVAISVEEKNDD